MTSPPAKPWHAWGGDEVARTFASDPERGLSRAEAAQRLVRDGPNELHPERGPTRRTLLARQFQSLVVWLLIGAALVSCGLGEWLDGGAILAIVALNAALGFFQELRAERAVTALARLTAPRARVVRDGHSEIVPARDVVRGDLVLLEAGDLVPADARLLTAERLRVNEGPLTGESDPVEKATAPLPERTPLADRNNGAFLGTIVTDGSARALVVATGMHTEVGRIASLVGSASRDTAPLQRRLEQVGRQLMWACLAVVCVVLALGWLRGLGVFELFLNSVSLAVAAVPEGLPAVATVALALGVERMARRRALVRRLHSVETLGSTEVICTDKTGTLTVGQMTVRELIAADETWAVSGEGAAASGEIVGADDSGVRLRARALLWAAAACNDAELREEGGSFRGVGDTTEVALLVAAAKGGVRREAIEAAEPRVRTLPFDAARKRMTVVRHSGAECVAYVKGAPEVVLARCAFVRGREGVVPLDAARRAELARRIERAAARALRLLAIAERALPPRPLDDPSADVETELTLDGFVAMQDAPRAEVREAIAKCRRAGIRVVMITGDHPATARAIGGELGVLNAGDEVMSGSELEAISPEALRDRVANVAAFARVTAEQKLDIVRAWKARGAIVAMTGDGVNDAPALREASIGIAMGRSGTEVAKQAADLVIADDDFSSIVAAVEEGRGIFDNVSKTLAYLLAGNAAELALMLAAGVLGLPVPLLPVQLLWINLVTDGLPALALATDPIDPHVLERPPRPASARLADAAGLRTLLVTGALTAAVALGAYVFALQGGADDSSARNAAFSTLVFAELLRSFGARSETRSIFAVGLFSNLRLFAVVAASFALQLAIHHESKLAAVFGTQPISLAQCIAQIGVGAIPLAVLELRKLVLRRAAARGASH